MPPPGRSNSYGLLRTHDCPGPACTHDPKVGFQVAKAVTALIQRFGQLTPTPVKANAVGGVYSALAVALVRAADTTRLSSRSSVRSNVTSTLRAAQREQVVVLVWLRTGSGTAVSTVRVEGVGASGRCFDVRNMTGQPLDVPAVCVNGTQTLLVPRVSAQPLYLFPKMTSVDNNTLLSAQ